MPKLKHSDLTPFRWYPVEEVEKDYDGYILAFADNEYDVMRWSNYHRRFVGRWGSDYEPQFVMRLLTPDEQVDPMHEALHGYSQTRWKVFREVDGGLLDCTPPEDNSEEFKRAWDNYRRRVFAEIDIHGEISMERIKEIAKQSTEHMQ